MADYASRAHLSSLIPPHELCRSNILDAPEAFVCWLFSGCTIDHAAGIYTKVRQLAVT